MHVPDDDLNRMSNIPSVRLIPPNRIDELCHLFYCLCLAGWHIGISRVRSRMSCMNDVEVARWVVIVETGRINELVNCSPDFPRNCERDGRRTRVAICGVSHSSQRKKVGGNHLRFSPYLPARIEQRTEHGCACKKAKT